MTSRLEKEKKSDWVGWRGRKKQQDIQNNFWSVANRKHARWLLEFLGIAKNISVYIKYIYVCTYAETVKTKQARVVTSDNSD